MANECAMRIEDGTATQMRREHAGAATIMEAPPKPPAKSAAPAPAPTTAETPIMPPTPPSPPSAQQLAQPSPPPPPPIDAATKGGAHVAVRECLLLSYSIPRSVGSGSVLTMRQHRAGLVTNKSICNNPPGGLLQHVRYMSKITVRGLLFLSQKINQSGADFALFLVVFC